MKRLLAAVLAAVMMTAMTAPAFAAHWEILQSGEWMVVLDNGSYATNQWINENGTYYFVGPNGVMLKNNYTPDGYWVGQSGAWEAQWGQRRDHVEAEPFSGATYKGIYTYKFYKDTYGDGNVHWSMTEGYDGKVLSTYELYPMSLFAYEIMDIYSGECRGYLSVDKFRENIYVSIGNDTQNCKLQY